MKRGLIAEIDLGAAAGNLNAVKRAVGNRPVIAVVKADAYGHGAVELARTFERAGASALAVAFVSEAAELREAGLRLPILVLFDNTDISRYFDLGLIPVIQDLKTAKAFSAEAGKRGSPVEVHLKADTGMGRLGFNSWEEMSPALELPNLKISGLMSHFSEADLADRQFMELQLKKFKEIRDSLKRALKGDYVPPLCHMANSAAIVSFEAAHLDAVRPGLMLYGVHPLNGEGRFPVKPVMKVKARVLTARRLGKGRPVSYGRTFITGRDTLAAVLAAGYADGFPRSLSNRGHVLLNGKRAPVIGRVCMDLTIVDATDTGDVSPGDYAVLLGDGIPAWEVADAASTIPYEILTSFGSRAGRVYLPAPKQ